MPSGHVIEAIAGGGPHAARTEWAEIMALSEAAHDAVLTPRESDGITHVERAALAHRVARLGSDTALAAHEATQRARFATWPKFAAMALSCSPPAATPAMVAVLRARRFDETAILDLILSVALFGWANRLMHTLGGPVAE